MFLAENSRLITLKNAYQVKLIQESIGSIRDVILGRLYSFYFKDYQFSEYKLRRADMQNKYLQMSQIHFNGLFSLIGLIAFVVVISSPNPVLFLLQE